MNTERMRAWFVARRKWLVPLICVVIGSALGYEGRIVFETDDTDPPPPVVEFEFVDE